MRPAPRWLAPFAAAVVALCLAVAGARGGIAGAHPEDPLREVTGAFTGAPASSSEPFDATSTIFPPDDRLQVTDTTVAPFRAIVHLRFFRGGVRLRQCSGTMVAPNAVLTVPYVWRFRAIGSDAAVVWTLTWKDGRAPGGLSFDAAKGELSGTATVQNSYEMTVTAAAAEPERRNPAAPNRSATQANSHPAQSTTKPNENARPSRPTRCNSEPKRRSGTQDDAGGVFQSVPNAWLTSDLL